MKSFESSHKTDDFFVPNYKDQDIKRIRKSLNLTQPKFAKLLGVSLDTVKSWEIGRYIMSESTQRLLFLIEHDKSNVSKLSPKETSEQTSLLDE